VNGESLKEMDGSSTKRYKDSITGELTEFCCEFRRWENLIAGRRD